nr:TPA_asm: Bcl2 [Astyanax tetra cavefish adintovirus]
MGNFISSLKAFSNKRLKDRAASLLCKVIELRVNNETFNTSRLIIDQHAVSEIEKKMDVVRCSTAEWDNLLSTSVSSSYPLDDFIHQVLKQMFETSFDYSSSHLLCIFTYVIDACVLKMSNKENVDVGKTIDCMLSFLMEKNVNIFHITRLLSL